MTRRLRLPVLVAVVVLAVLSTLTSSVPAVAAAGKPAPVKITLKPNVTGKVTSDRAVCIKQRGVSLFGRTSAGDVIQEGTTLTDDQGRYPGEITRRGTLPTELFTVVVGDPRCKIAQSPSIAAPTRQAGQPAKRRVSLQVGPSALTGRVTSKRAACVKGATVVIFVRTSGGPWASAIQTTTDKKGRYVFGPGGRRGQIQEITAVAIGDDRCSVAQSPLRQLG